ncbi:MAG: hypothetical protein O7A63_02520 [Acidobacteria bacterium]|nr:hypothetical protein [Acidobacteriota bacterium]
MAREPQSVVRRMVLMLTLVVLAMALPRAPALARTDDRHVSIASLLSGDRNAEADVALSIDGPAAALSALSGERDFPIPCATLPLAAMSESGAGSLGGRIRAAASRPVLEDPRRLAAVNGRYTIRYSGLTTAPNPDRNRNGHPDRLDRIAESIEAAHSYLVEHLGFPSPAPQRGTLDILLAPLGHGLEGYTIGGGETSPRLVLDSGLSADRLMPAVLHQMAHASLQRIVPRDRSFWSEATATWLEVSAVGDPTGASAGLAARFLSPDRPLEDDGLLMMSGAMLWPMFLADRTGDPSIVRQVWQEMALEGVDAIEAARRTLVRAAGITLEEAFREFVGWNLLTASRDDGLHYSIGSLLPESRLITLGPAPFQVDPVDAIGPLGSLAFRIEGNRRKGALSLEIYGTGGRPEADLFATFESEGSQRLLIPVPIDRSGTGRVELPWSDVAEVWIVLRNASTTPGDEARFQVRGGHDPYGPFDLAGFTARPLGPTLQLEWTTASESGLMGWNVQRATTPEGPFLRLNGIAVPAFGDSKSEIGYVFVDGSTVPGRRYYYRLEGLTTLGLVERSHIVSGRVPPRP